MGLTRNADGPLDVSRLRGPIALKAFVAHASVPLGEGPGLRTPVEVTSETGVIVATEKDPTGRRTAAGVYEATGVAVGNSRSAPPPPPGPDPRVLQDRLKANSLPEGKTAKAIAGYLYFPKPPKKPKDGSLELIYLRASLPLALSLPSK